jgi:hypothetical protein
VLPRVPEVIIIEELFAQPEAKVNEAHPVGVVTEADASYPGNPVLLPVDPKLVEVSIGPPHGDLKDMVQVGNDAVTTDQQPAPDHRAEAEQDDFELVDGRFCDR